MTCSKHVYYDLPLIQLEHYIGLNCTCSLGKNYTTNKVLTGDGAYDPTVNPSTSQEFSTGAFRVLHNIIPSQYGCECVFIHFIIIIYIFVRVQAHLFQIHRFELHDRASSQRYRLDGSPVSLTTELELWLLTERLDKYRRTLKSTAVQFFGNVPVISLRLCNATVVR